MCPDVFNVNDWIQNTVLFFNFFKAKTKFNQITSEAYKPFQIPSNQSKEVDLTINELNLLKKSDKDIEIHIHPIEIPILDEELSDHNPTFIIGGMIIGNKKKIKEFSFSVCLVFITNRSFYDEKRGKIAEEMVCEDSCCLPKHCDIKRVVRRIHFDFQPKHGEDLKFHIQIGGEFSPGNYCKSIHYCMEHFIEKPRIPCQPWDFVFLFNYMLTQFDTPLDHVKKEKYWHERVNSSRDLIRDLN